MWFLSWGLWSNVSPIYAKPFQALYCLTSQQGDESDYSPFYRQETEVQRREELSQPRSGQIGGCVPSKTGTSTQPDFRIATGNEYPDVKLHRDLMREPQGCPPKLS